MGNIQANQASSTPLYKQVIDSKPVHFAKDKPVLAGAGLVGSGVIVAEAARHSDLLATSLKKGAVPLIATGVAVLGASAVKDAVQNDWQHVGKDLESTAKFVGKAALGTAVTAGGVEIAAQTALGVSPLGKAAQVIGKVFPNESLGFVPFVAAGVTSTVLGVKSMQEKGVTLGNATAVGLGATAAVQFTGTTLWFANQFNDSRHIIGKVSDKATATVGGAALGLGAYALGKHALKAIDEGKSGEAVLAAVGATTAGVAAVHVLGNATGIQALSNLGQKVFMKNPLLAGSITAVAMAGAGYYMYSKSESSETKPEQK